MKLHQVKILCQTENKYVPDSGWYEEQNIPTTCPNNAAHTINSNSTVITETIDTSAQKIELKQSPNFDQEKITMTTEGVVLTVLDGQNNLLKIFKKNYYIEVDQGTLLDPVNEGDTISIYVQKKDTVQSGSLEEDVIVGQKTFVVSQSVIDSVLAKPGSYLSLGSNSYVDLYEIEAINKDTRAITISTTLASAHDNGSGVFLKDPIAYRANLSKKEYARFPEGGIARLKPLPPEFELALFYESKTNVSGNKTILGNVNFAK